jgi:hypothetical protein
MLQIDLEGLLALSWRLRDDKLVPLVAIKNSVVKSSVVVVVVVVVVVDFVKAGGYKVMTILARNVS